MEMTANESQERQDLPVPERETPWSLQFFAAALFIVGILALVGMVLGALQRLFFFDVAVIAIFMSAGLFHCRPGWRIATLVIVPAYCMVVVPGVFFIWTVPYLQELEAKEDVFWALEYSCLGIRFLFGVWCLWVLNRPAVRQAFARSHARGRTVEGPQPSNQTDTDGG